MSLKRISKAWADQNFMLSVGFPSGIAGPSDFVTRWNISYEENDKMVGAQDDYYDKWASAQKPSKEFTV